MKKIIATVLLSTLVLPVLTACPDQGPVETRTEEEIIIDNGITAMGQVGISFVNLSGSTGMTKDIALKASLNVDGYIYKFEYTLTTSFTYERDWVWIEDGSAGKTLKSAQPGQEDLPEDNKSFAFYTLKIVPTFTGYAADFEAPRGLTITETYKNKKYTDLGKNYGIRVNAGITIECSAAELYTNKNFKNNETRAITYGIYAGAQVDPAKFDASSSKYSLYFDDGEHSFVAYDESVSTIPANLVVGQVYKVYGVYSNYYNTVEIKNYTLTPDTTHTCAPAVKTAITGTNLKEYSHASTTAVVTNATITKVEVGYGDEFEYGKTKVSIYVNITGATKDDGTLKDELYAYVHQFDLEEDYTSWSNCFTVKNQASWKGAKVSFEGRAYWYSGFPAFYHSHVTSFTAPTAA